MNDLSFAKYLSQRRPNYTYEARLLEQIKNDAAFAGATSWEAVERYLSARDAPLGLRQYARAVWKKYRQLKARTSGNP